MRRCRAGLPPPERRSLSAALPSHWLSITFRKTMTVPQDLLRPGEGFIVVALKSGQMCSDSLGRRFDLKHRGGRALIQSG